MVSGSMPYFKFGNFVFQLLAPSPKKYTNDSQFVYGIPMILFVSLDF